MNLREIVLYAIAALCVYLVWICIRLIRTKRKAFKSTVKLQEPETIHSQILGGDSSREYSSASYDSNEPIADLPIVSQIAEPDTAAFGFDGLLELRQLGHRFNELETRYHKLEDLVSKLNDEVRGLRAACQVAPAYNEAVALARRGFDAAAIAERCGISVAEAELVASLSSDDNGEKRDE